MKHVFNRYLLIPVILLAFGFNLMAQYEENDAYLIITGMRLNEDPQSYVKDPSFGKDAVVKITPKGGVAQEKQTSVFSVKKDGLTYYTADYKIPLDSEYSIDIRFSNGATVNIPDYKLLSSWKTHFYFHSTDGTLSAACILRSQSGLEKDLRLCVFAVYPYENYVKLGGKQTFTEIESPIDNPDKMNVLPNPVSNIALLRFQLDEPTQVSISVKTPAGMLLQQYSGFYPQGLNQLNLLEEKQFRVGMYIIELSANGQKYVRKMLVAK